MTENGKITVLLVDDSIVQRQLLRSVLSTEPDIEVVSHAVNGRLALPRVRHLKPDLVVLDQEMPEMNGLHTLDILNREFPETGVIMYCSPTSDSALTIRALQMGALDFVTKPDARLDAAEYVRSVLVPRIRALGRRRKSQPAWRENSSAPRVFDTRRFDICAIGISTGGPQALREVFSRLGKVSGSIVIAQHMPPLFTEQLANSLTAISAVPVEEVTGETMLLPGHAYLAPGGRHMRIAHRADTYYAFVTDEPPELNCRPSVNILFRSVAEAASDKAIGVIMTGMGNDGQEGMGRMKERGAYLVAQTADSCLVYGMPAGPIEENLVDVTDDPAGIARIINQGMTQCQ